MEDEIYIPIITQPEVLFADLREQMIVTRLTEGLLCLTDPSFAPGDPGDEQDPLDALPADSRD